MSVFTLPSVAAGPWPEIQVLDIGAMPEGTPRFQPLVDLGLAAVTCFEPQEEERARLAALPGRRQVLPYFLGDGNPAIFHQTRYPGCSSLLEPDAAVIDLFCYVGASDPTDNFYVEKRTPVGTVRLDDLADCPAPDYVKIDVQGAELLVLGNGTRKIAGATVIECEVEFLPLYKNQPLFGDVQRFMAEQGLVFHKLCDIAGRNFEPLSLPDPATAISQALWADAIFVRDFTRIGAYTELQLLKTALIAHEVYRSYDFVLFLLLEHDKRAGGKLGPAYHAALRQAKSLPMQLMTFKTQV